MIRVALITGGVLVIVSVALLASVTRWRRHVGRTMYITGWDPDGSEYLSDQAVHKDS